VIASVVGLPSAFIDREDPSDPEPFVPLGQRPGERNGTRRHAPYRCCCPSCVAIFPARAAAALVERASIFLQSERPRCAGCGAMRALVGRLCWKCQRKDPTK
jgi:hypothetical protein